MFQTKYNFPEVIPAETYIGVKSCTQPEQVLPLKRILDGLKNGTIILNSAPQDYDIPEHDIDVVPGKTPEQTNANIASATAADLAESADKSGEIITAHPGFQIEDAQPIADLVEAVIEDAKRSAEGSASKSKSSSADGEQKSATSDMATAETEISDHANA